LKHTWLFILIFLLPACFLSSGIKNPGKVQGYKLGLVKTEKGSYGVGVLPPAWKQSPLAPYKVLVFYNESYQSSIETDAFCDRSFDDASLSVLTTHLHVGIAEKKIKKENPFMLDGRAALRSIVNGKVDGVEVVLDSVVIKKDNCLFDFVLVSKPSKYSGAVSDFEKFFEGFRYNGDI